MRQAAVKALGAIGPGADGGAARAHPGPAAGSWPEAQEAVRRIRGLEPGAPIELGPEEPETP